MATPSSILAWRIRWTEEPDGLQCIELQRVRHSWMTNTFTSFYPRLDFLLLSPSFFDSLSFLPDLSHTHTQPWGKVALPTLGLPLHMCRKREDKQSVLDTPDLAPWLWSGPLLLLYWGLFYTHILALVGLHAVPRRAWPSQLSLIKVTRSAL